MIIHTKKEQKAKNHSNATLEAAQARMDLFDQSPDDLTKLDARFFEGLSPNNPLGITVRTSQNGSMTKELFMTLVVHFVRYLPEERTTSKL
jgi:3-dehydroquinate dehydratase